MKTAHEAEREAFLGRINERSKEILNVHSRYVQLTCFSAQAADVIIAKDELITESILTEWNIIR